MKNITDDFEEYKKFTKLLPRERRVRDVMVMINTLIKEHDITLRDYLESWHDKYDYLEQLDNPIALLLGCKTCMHYQDNSACGILRFGRIDASDNFCEKRSNFKNSDEESDYYKFFR